MSDGLHAGLCYTFLVACDFDYVIAIIKPRHSTLQCESGL